MYPQKWQMGTVFIPDSIGYLLGTNFFGVIAYSYGRVKTAVLAMLLVGLSAMAIPAANSMAQLVIPHLCLGLGIGVADAALVPLLASFVDQTGGYGPVYSIQQIAVSLAYSLGTNGFRHRSVRLAGQMVSSFFSIELFESFSSNSCRL